MKLNNFIHEDYIADLNICDGLIKWFHSNKKYHHKGAFGSVDGTPEVDIKKKHSTDISFDIEEAAEVAVVAAYNKELQIMKGLNCKSKNCAVVPPPSSEYTNLHVTSVFISG